MALFKARLDRPASRTNDAARVRLGFLAPWLFCSLSLRHTSGRALMVPHIGRFSTDCQRPSLSTGCIRARPSSLIHALEYLYTRYPALDVDQMTSVPAFLDGQPRTFQEGSVLRGIFSSQSRSLIFLLPTVSWIFFLRILLASHTTRNSSISHVCQ